MCASLAPLDSIHLCACRSLSQPLPCSLFLLQTPRSSGQREQTHYPRRPRQHRRSRAFAKHRRWGSGMTANWGRKRESEKQRGREAPLWQSECPPRTANVLPSRCSWSVRCLEFLSCGTHWSLSDHRHRGILRISLVMGKPETITANESGSEQAIKSKYPYRGEGYTEGTQKNGKT